MGANNSHEGQLEQSAHELENKKQEIDFKGNDFIREVEGSIQSEYEILSPYLKKNEFYQLRKAIHLKTKLIRSVYVINKYKVRTVQREALEQQINKLKQIDHPFLNKIYELFKDSHRYFIVMELCFGQSLASIIENQTSISEQRAAFIMQQIFSVLGHCHRKGIVHSDLQLENIIFNCQKQNVIKIVDFSISKIFRIEDIVEQSNGKAFLSSPQSLTKDVTPKSDIWQCGMILYILLCGQAPIIGNKKSALARKIIYFVPTFTQRRMQSVSKQAKDLIRSLLKLNPNDRPTAQMCLQSPWMKRFYNPPSISSINLKRCLLECYHFNPLSKLQEATWSFFVNALVPFLEKQNIVMVFNKLDVEAKGELGFKQVFKGFNQIYENQQKAQFFTQLLFGRLKRTKITFSQFITIATNRIFLIKDSNIKKIFQIFDEDASGQITVGELKHVLGASKQVSEEIWLELMKEADANSDGMISFEQFQDMMRSLLNRQNEQVFEERQAQKIQFTESEGSHMGQLPVYY